MNVVNLAHVRLKNQENDNLLGFTNQVTGVTKISRHERNLRDYALELVGSFAKFKSDHFELSLEMLLETYQLELTRLYIESIDREIEYACYGEDETLNSDFLCAMLSMLHDSSSETRENFAQITIKNILKYYKNTLQKILDEACEDYYENQMHEAGYQWERDIDHGDFVLKRL